MGIKQVILSITMALLIASSQASAATDGQFNSIKNLGQLNGVALHCKYFDETRRMKKALVEALPKRRQLGKAFEDFTNESFLLFIQSGSSCPDQKQFIADVDTSIEGLNTAFTR